MTPKISIIIPTYNRAFYLDEAIASVLRQTASEIEVIVSDNCSADNTSQVVEKYKTDPRFRYVRNETNLGMVGNWRKALHEHIHADWFMILSDDDYLVDDTYLDRVIQLIRLNDLVLVYANGYIHWVEDNRKQPLSIPFCGEVDGKDVFVSRGTIKPQDFTLCNVVFRRDLAIKFNAFSDSDNYCCDTELFLMSCLEGKVYVFPEQVSAYRMHGSNLISKVMFDPVLASGDLTAYLKPYLMAKQNGNKELAENFYRNVQLKAKIRRVMFLGWIAPQYWEAVCEKLSKGNCDYLIGHYRSCLIGRLLRAACLKSKKLSTTCLYLRKKYIESKSTAGKMIRHAAVSYWTNFFHKPKTGQFIHRRQ